MENAKGEKENDREIIYDRGRGSRGVENFQIESISDCEGIKCRITETGIFDDCWSCKYSVFLQKGMLQCIVTMHI